MRSKSLPLLPLYAWQSDGYYLNYADRQTGVTWGVTGFNAGVCFTNLDPRDQKQPAAPSPLPGSGEPVHIPVPDIGDPGPNSR
jgi:hypothetical protein